MASRASDVPRVLALAGPTASGKSAAALAIARAHEVEIISVDSALVYRGMDIGTAKPTRAERALVPHHLIDIRDPLQAYSAAEFAADATALIAQINARGRLALLVGGTMLYFKALFEGLDPMPPADAGVRASLEAEAAIQGWPALHAALAQVDPATAARLESGWRRRTRSGSSARSRCSASPASRSPAFMRRRRGSRRPLAQLRRPRWCRWNRRSAAGCTRGSPGASMPCLAPASSMK
jgi:hypothetical protein